MEEKKKEEKGHTPRELRAESGVVAWVWVRVVLCW